MSMLWILLTLCCLPYATAGTGTLRPIPTLLDEYHTGPARTYRDLIDSADTDLQEHLRAAKVSTAQGRAIDVRQALAQRGVPDHQYLPILMAYEDWIQDHQNPYPEQLPEEFRRYRLAIDAMQRKDLPAARDQLAALAVPSNTYRATWAAYMLGNLETSAARRSAAYQKVRALAAGGGRDSLGLALASLRQEAYLYQQTAPDRFLRNCVLYRQHGGRLYCNQLDLYVEDLLDDPDAAIESVVADPLANIALSATLLSSLKPVHQSSGRFPRETSREANTSQQRLQNISATRPAEDPWMARWQRWYQEMVQTNAAAPGNTAVLAWAMYEVGLYDEAAQVVEHVAEDTPLRAWVEAHLLLRSGDRPEAIRRLQHAAASSDDPAYAITLGHQLVRVERFDEALAAFLQAGAWFDVAWVAERIMTIEELMAALDTWPPTYGVPPEALEDLPSAPYYSTHWVMAYRRASDTGNDEVMRWPVDALQATLLRALLVRRLGREGRWDEALQVAPPYERNLIEQLLLLQAMAARSQGTTQGRLLWKQAQILREHGTVLLATEFAPDFAVYLFNFTYEDNRLTTHRLGQNISETERQRLSEQVMPQTRFHYRQVAAELAWEAALVMPDNNDETMQILCQAGHWLHPRNPEQADPFYKAMVNRGRMTPIGQLADQRRWFPRIVNGQCVTPTSTNH